MRSLLPVMLCLALAGCHSNMQNEDAVKRGIMDYLSTRQGLNIASMNVSVSSMVFRANEVDATVMFAPKDSGAAQPMAIHYVLERKGDRWVVKPRAGAGQNPHGGMGANPHGGGMPMPEGAGNPAGALPPGHPAVPPQDSGAR
ncbi:MAG: hypothetical protein ABSG65_18540 [Bryobacteraceae bacterium]